MPIQHINYSGQSKPIIRLAEAVNYLIDNGGGGGGDGASCQIDKIIPQLEAIQAGVSALTSLTARVENNILILEGTGAAVGASGNLILNSNQVYVDNGILYFRGE